MFLFFQHNRHQVAARFWGSLVRQVWTRGTDMTKWNRLTGILLLMAIHTVVLTFVFLFPNCKPEQVSPWSLIQADTFILLSSLLHALRKFLPLFTPDSKPSVFNPV